MESIVKGVSVIRNNWKKTIFFSGVAGWGIKYSFDKYKESILREVYAHEAKKYGHELVKLGSRPKRLLVFYNPAASGGKARKLFDKNAAPLLHLAGFEVTVIKTEYAGQAKQYMEVLEDGSTDAIVVAGGNGTLSEVITGLLRRPDQNKMSRLPIAVIPLGQTNSVAEWFLHKGESAVRWQLEAAMAIIKGFFTSVDVMAIKGAEGKTIYAVSDFQWGTFEEANQLKPKYWYMGPLKHVYPFFKQTLAKWPPTLNASMTYMQPCDGCSKCSPPPPVPKWRWWHLFFRPARQAPVKDYSGIVNEECGRTHSAPVSTLQFSVSTVNNENNPGVEGKHRLSIATEPESMDKSEFIKAGWQKRNMKISSNSFTEARWLKLNPILTEESVKWFTIDNERFEAMPVEIELLKNKLTFSCSPNTLQPFLS